MPLPLTKALTLAAALVAGTATVAMAEKPGSDWVKKDMVMKNLKEAGFTDVKDLKAEHKRWEAKGMIDGKTWELHIDPHTGKIEKVEKPS